MNIYDKKSRWKLWLLLSAALIVFASLWYTNILAGRIAEEEQKQVRIWAQAVENKARLVRYMTDVFQRMAIEERKKVELWASAQQKLIEAEDEIDYFVIEVVQNNQTVPVVLLDEEDNIISYRNIDSSFFNGQEKMTPELKQQFTSYEPITFQPQFQENRNYIYYRDSRLFSELKVVLQDFINSFITEDVMKAASVPVIFTNGEDEVIEFSNLDTAKVRDPEYLQATLASMRSENEPIPIDLGDNNVNYVYYEDSALLNQITFYPYVQLAIIGLFLLVAYFAFSTARRAEQNQVWVGMSKETAHQLGTPISSLIAWVEYLRETGTSEKVLVEIEKDVNRLELITERFSKIGSLPTLVRTDIIETLHQSLQYLKTRASKKTIIEEDIIEGPVYVKLSPALFDWVIENLIKNALDAMEGVGKMSIHVFQLEDKIYIDLTDSGKGIPSSKFATVFQPGYSTKKRGWGLGLSLSKRIIENYHNGKIMVKESNIGKGTTFRIILPVAAEA